MTYIFPKIQLVRTVKVILTRIIRRCSIGYKLNNIFFLYIWKDMVSTCRQAQKRVIVRVNSIEEFATD